MVERSFERGGGACVLRRARSSHPWALEPRPSLAAEGPPQHTRTSASGHVSIDSDLESVNARFARVHLIDESTDGGRHQLLHSNKSRPVPGTGGDLFTSNEGATLDVGRATGDRCGGASPVAGPEHRSPVARPDRYIHANPEHRSRVAHPAENHPTTPAPKARGSSTSSRRADAPKMSTAMPARTICGTVM